MSDDLVLPQVPDAKPEDPEDVSWALSTAEAMWARGDHAEGIKWVRRAAEAASEAEKDDRALELAKAAADLKGLITQRGASRASINLEDADLVAAAPPPPVPTRSVVPARPAAAKPSINVPKINPATIARQPAVPSRAPAPLPSRTSEPPPAAGRSVPPVAGASRPAKPLGTNAAKPVSVRPSSTKTADKEKKDSSKKSARRSRENLDAESRAATQAQTAGDDASGAFPPDTTEVAALAALPPGGLRLADSDPTMVGRVDTLAMDVPVLKPKARPEQDLGATQSLSTEDLSYGDRPTALGRVPGLSLPAGDTTMTASRTATTAGSSPPATIVGSRLSPAPGRSSAPDPHDPAITTTQAVRVVVWRDGNGVHVAPAGTVVSAITVDAMLVAMDPNADLTAWLSERGPKGR